MTIKRMLLLLSAMAALVAFAAPAAAQADSWVFEGSTIEGEKEVEASGEITSEALGGAFKTGPAEVDFSVTLTNSGTSQITAATITGEPATNLPGCKANAGTTSNLPWNLDTANPALTITNVTFTNHYSSGCAAFGVPSTVSAAGSVTGTVSGECIVLSQSGDLKNEATNGAVNLTGEVCLPGVTLES